MVQDIDRSRQTSPFPESAPVANIVFYRTYGRRGEKATNLCKTWNKVCNHTSKQMENTSNFDWLNVQVCSFLKCANKLAKIDERIEKISRPLAEYSHGVSCRPLGTDGPRLVVERSERRLVISAEQVAFFAKNVPKKHLRTAILVSLFHEVSHITQNIEDHDDVQRMKSTDRYFGRQRMSEIDLQSDFLAVNALSLFQTFRAKKTFVPKHHVCSFNQIWSEACYFTLPVKVEPWRTDKLQRIFGYLLMSNLTRDASLKSRRSLGFEAELWPVWGKSLDHISIFTDKEPLVRGNPVDPNQMRLILQCITTGQHHKAATKIDDLWRELPRRC